MTNADAAHEWWDAGCAPLPAATDGTKRPAVNQWRQWQQLRPDWDTTEALFTHTDSDGIGILCGTASGHLEMLELEAAAVTGGLTADLRQAFTDHGQDDLWRTITTGCAEITPSGGLHWYYRVDGGAKPNTKLARRPTEGGGVQVLIETRGEGGWSVVAPSGGRTHPSGRPWTRIAGSPATIPTITSEQRDLVHDLCRLSDLMPEVQAAQPQPSAPHDGGLRPGDDFAARTSWDDILLPQGWTKASQRGRQATWVRPGKKVADGISATSGRGGTDNLFVFSSSTTLPTEEPLSKLFVWAHYHTNGDMSAAAAALRQQGFGAPSEPARLTLVPPTPATAPGVDGTAALAPKVVAVERAAAAFGPTEDGTARALAHLHRHQLRYCAQRQKWLTWTGARWQWDDGEVHRQHIKELARGLPEDDGWKAYKKRALSASGTTGIARQAESEPAFATHIDDLDANPYELNTPGGIVDLRTGTIRPADPTALHTRSTSVAPDFDRPGERFEAFLSDTFGGDQALITYVQRLIGVSAIGTVLEQLLPFAFGHGANGKSTLIEAVMDALGRGEEGYAIAAAAEMLMIRRHTEHPAELAQLAGARLVVCSELEDGARFAEARIKQLTGSDSINARFMRGNPFTFTPSHTIWLIGNHKPAATTGGDAFWRRLQLIPFEHTVPIERRDKRLPEQLRDEAPAVLAWVVRGAADYAAHGLGTPPLVAQATRDYAADQDTVGRFVAEQCQLPTSAHAAPHLQVATSQLREAYERFCRECGDDPVSAKRLTQELRDRFGVESKSSNSRRWYVGVTLCTDEQETPSWP